LIERFGGQKRVAGDKKQKGKFEKHDDHFLSLLIEHKEVLDAGTIDSHIARNEKVRSDHTRRSVGKAWVPSNAI
jgi:hypothetical protein